VVLLGAAACGNHSDVDAAVPTDGGGRDLPVELDTGAQVAGAFTIVGCATLDQRTEQPTCRGAAPLTLTFVPLVSGADTFAWTFQGGSPASARVASPTVVYAQPGSYMVALAAGGPGGTLAASGLVLVAAGGVGAPCSGDADCDAASGLACLCGDGSCPGALRFGLCTRPCGGSLVCAPGEVCVDLSRGVPAPVDGGAAPTDGGAGEDWRQPLCLPGCASSAQCRVGFACRELPVLLPGASAGGAYTWRSGCFADHSGDDGEAGAAPDGSPAPASCLSGDCAALGARALCTSDCGQTACPTSAGCATFNGQPGHSTCLYRCDPQKPVCPSADPLVDCEPPGRAGALGFSIGAGEPAAATYCAPKRCAGPSDCAPAGVCTSTGGGSFCVKAP
jgi:hypothetical protein